MTWVASVDVGGTTTKVARVSLDDARVANHHWLPTPAGNPDAFAGELADLIRPLDCAALGIAAPGFADDDRSRILYNPNTPVTENFPLRDRLAELTGLRAAFEIDCNAAALAEHRFGAGRDTARLLVLTLGTGVGAGFLQSGVPLRITGQCPGDLGHVYVGAEGRRCSAGCNGCLESVLSVAARGGTAQQTRGLIDSAVAGDPAAQDRIRCAGRYLGIALASLSSILKPELVLLTGGIATAGDLLTAAAQETFDTHAARGFAVPVRMGRFIADAAIIGAAVAAGELL